MVLPAVLRHPAGDPEQASRRHGARGLDRILRLSGRGSIRRRSGRHAIARSTAVLLGVRHRLHRAWGGSASKPPEGNYVLFARIFTVYYFAYFLVILPILGKVEKKPSRCRTRSRIGVAERQAALGAPAPPPTARQGLRHIMVIAALSLSPLRSPRWPLPRKRKSTMSRPRR